MHGALQKPLTQRQRQRQSSNCCCSTFFVPRETRPLRSSCCTSDQLHASSMATLLTYAHVHSASISPFTHFECALLFQGPCFPNCRISRRLAWPNSSMLSQESLCVLVNIPRVEFLRRHSVQANERSSDRPTERPNERATERPKKMSNDA